jgi:hypothetical protein
MKRLASLLAAASLAAPLAACTTSDPYAGAEVKSDNGKADASALGVFLDAELTGKLVTDYAWDTNQTIQDQLLYTIGELNGLTAVGRLDKVELTNVEKTTTSDGKVQITYTAKLPIIWNKRDAIPEELDLPLPLDISSRGQEAFADKYKESCVDWGAHDVDAGSMFYYFRPHASGCHLDSADIFTAKAQLSPSETSTTGKFPEYDKVWEDGTLNVVAIFGKYEDGATSNDAGIDAFDEFVAAMKGTLGSHGLTTVPADVPDRPGASAPDIELSAKLADGKQIHVVALLTDDIQHGLADPTFRARYEALSTHADFIAYNGHAGLGSNVRALASAGKWIQGQYVIVFMNGCDTYAYIDASLSQAHQALNPDDTTGWKYLDIVNNGQPAFFASMAGASMAMFRGLLDVQNPQTYEQIFANIDDSQLVMVTGEQDNTFTPGGGGAAEPWGGLSDSGSVARSETKQWTTPNVAAGRYRFDLTGTGDADLYVRIGADPTTSTYDCRPYLTGSTESCTVSLAQPSTIHVMVRGYASASTFELTGKPL